MSRRSYKEKGGHDSKCAGLGHTGKTGVSWDKTVYKSPRDSVVIRRWGSRNGKEDLEKALLCLGRQHKDCGRVLLELLQTHILWGGNDATNTRRACLDRRERKILNAAFERLPGSLLRPETRAATVWVWTGCQVHVQMRGEGWTPRPFSYGVHGAIPVCHFSGRADSRVDHLVEAEDGCAFQHRFVL